MEKIEKLIRDTVKIIINNLYNFTPTDNLIQIQSTRKEFKGDITLVIFPFLKFSQTTPEKTAATIGKELQTLISLISDFNVVKGFLNLQIIDSYWVKSLEEAWALSNQQPTIDNESQHVMIEYSSPNTNKPLHLGHIRNILLGHSISEISKAAGNRVIKTNIVNDRGIHICKSMLAWKEYGEGQTPQSTGIKGDHLVGKFYVEFDKHYKAEIEALIAEGRSQEEAENEAPSINKAREMLRKWEDGDPETVEMWRVMNEWVYEGFDATYEKLGVTFDKIYYESDTYLVGKEEVLAGLAQNIFYKKEDGSVWADLSKEGLDQKILLRSDGTSVYMTQDIGTAKLRYDDFNIDRMIYVVGNEQNYHFQVLSVILDKLGYKWGKELNHFSYGMVELPSGKMKSREGTVVDADDLIAGMIDIAKDMSEQLGKLDELTDEEAARTHEMIAMGALKYFILKVDPRKNMLFNPEESIDFNGNTGPFIQYTHARIQSVLRRAAQKGVLPTDKIDNLSNDLSTKERDLIKRAIALPEVISEANLTMSPSVIANYCYDLAKEYNQFYHDHPIINEDDPEKSKFRLLLSAVTGKMIRTGMKLLGIEVPDRM